MRCNPKIQSLENTDIRSWTPHQKFPLIVADVSFISLREIIPSIQRLLESQGRAILLFKPQFEVGRENLTKAGVPKSEAIRLNVLEAFRVYLNSVGLRILNEQESTLSGEAGNREVLFMIEDLSSLSF